MFQKKKSFIFFLEKFFEIYFSFFFRLFFLILLFLWKVGWTLSGY